MNKTIFVSGNFNIIHPGHLRLLKFAKELGDKLIVGVHSDDIGGQGVHIPQEMRLEGVITNIWVDEGFIINDSVKETIKKIKPDIVVKGKEYENSHNPEIEALKTYGGKLIFSSGEVVFSSLDLISKDIYEKREAVDFPHEFAERHNFSKSDLNNVIKSLSGLNVTIVGDLIVDEYISCDPLGMSQEDPSIVVTPIERKKYIGGAGIVAAHAVGLGAKVNFFTVSGEDEARDFAENKLNSYGVNTEFFTDESRPTTLKQRFRANDKTLLRLSHLHQTAISRNIQDNLFDSFSQVLNKSDVVIFSDFNYGCLPQSLVEKMADVMNKKDLIKAADSQSSSQTGDISRFKEMDFLFPTEHEARISLRNNDDGLVVLSEKLSKLSLAKNIVLKLGSEGILLHLQSSEEGKETDKLEALNRFPKDVAGAGDSMLISTVLSFASCSDVWKSVCIGSLCAALQVAKLGNNPLVKEELMNYL